MKKYNLNGQKITALTVISLLLIVALYVKKNPDTAIYLFFSNSYSNILMYAAQVALKLSHSHFTFDFVHHIIYNAKAPVKINTFFYSLNQLALLLAVILFTQSPLKSKIIYFSTAFIIYFIYNTIRITVHVLYPETISTKNWLFNLLLIPQWIIFILFIHYYWKKFPQIKNFITQKYQITETAYQTFIQKLVLLLVLYYLMIIIIYNNIFIISGELLVSSLLKTSIYFIKQLGYDDILLLGRTLRSSQAALYMDDSCIGINLMYLFAAFIFLMPGKAIHKIWYIPAGLLAILSYNILRIVFIFISIANNQGKYLLPVEIHDIFTYPVLAFTLYMWIIWINKFADK